MVKTKTEWFPELKEELNELLERFIVGNKKKVNGIIVPHAGYQFSGTVAGKAFGLIEDIKKVVILGPSHDVGLKGVYALKKVSTPLGDVNIIENEFPKTNYDHSVVNQIPFLQKLNPNVEVLPLVVGELNLKEAKEIAEKLKDFEGLFVFSTDLSHFLEYDLAVETDMRSIGLIEDLSVSDVDACGKYPLFIMQELCKLKGWRPEKIDYQNSGDVNGEKASVVGYASFWF